MKLGWLAITIPTYLSLMQKVMIKKTSLSLKTTPSGTLLIAEAMMKRAAEIKAKTVAKCSALILFSPLYSFFLLASSCAL